MIYNKAEFQKDFLCPVSQFSTKKCPKYVFSEFCDNITHKIEQMLFSSQLSSFKAELCQKPTVLYPFYAKYAQLFENVRIFFQNCPVS